MTKDEEQVLSTSDDAAKFVTDIKGWVSRHGRFYGDNKLSEKDARYDGCTHRPCDTCGEATEKMWVNCNECREKSSIRRWNEREKKEWDEKTPLYSDAADEYFLDATQLQDYMCDNDLTIDDLRLVLCDPIHLRTMDLDYWDGELYEGVEPSNSILDAMDALNTAILEEGPVSWCPGKYAAIIEEPLFKERK